MNPSQIFFPDKWLAPDYLQSRICLLDAPDIARRISATKAGSIVGKTPECQKLIKKASSVWSLCADRYIFVFSNEKEDGLQKVTVWAKKLTGIYIRLKTVWTKLDDNIFEALPYFLSSYFDIDLPLSSMDFDPDAFYHLEDELRHLLHYPTAAVKGKEKLLRHWSEFLPQFNKMLAELDFAVLRKSEPGLDVKSPAQCDSPADMLETMAKLALASGIKSGKGSGPKNDSGANGNRISVESLMSSGRPVSIEEFNEALWHADYSDPLFSEADRILFSPRQSDTEDSDYPEAAILYDSLMGEEDIRKCRMTKFNRADRLIDIGNELLRRWKKDDFSLREFHDFNIQAPMYSFFREMANERICKDIAKGFKFFASHIISKGNPIGFETIGILINARITNRRLPKEISEGISEIFEHQVYPSQIWDGASDRSEDADYDRLLQEYLVTKTVELQKYDVEHSFPAERIKRESIDIFTNSDIRCHSVFSRWLTDYNWAFADTDYLSRYYNKLTRLQSPDLTSVDKLRIAAAKILVLRKLKSSPFLPLPSGCTADGNSATSEPDHYSQSISPLLSDASGSVPGSDTAQSKPSTASKFLQDFDRRSRNMDYLIAFAYRGTTIADYCAEKGLDPATFRTDLQSFLSSIPLD